uniref:hypothetical protein n=1 Tax=Rheinheimera sp. TaxID=1869214 RepID=UPI00404779DE
MANSATAINPMECTWPAERVAVLQQYHQLAIEYAEIINEEHQAGADEYYALMAKTKFRDTHGINDAEYRAFKSRNAVKVNSVAQAIETLTRMYVAHKRNA